MPTYIAGQVRAAVSSHSDVWAPLGQMLLNSLWQLGSVLHKYKHTCIPPQSTHLQAHLNVLAGDRHAEAAPRAQRGRGGGVQAVSDAVAALQFGFMI